MYSIKLTSLNEFFAAIAKNEKLYMPVPDGKGGAKYAEWKDGSEFAYTVNTTRSAKDFFFPQTENLVDFKVEGQHIEIIDPRTETEDFVIFGARACDVRSFEILDRVFLKEPVDSYYKNRRDHGTIVTLACTLGATGADENCFCSAFGIDSEKPEGDVRAYITDGSLYFEALTGKGEKLVDAVKSLAVESGTEAVDKAIAETEKAVKIMPLSGLTPKDFTQKQLEAFNAPVWADLSRTCLGCGTCTFVCPTCQCYDIKDFDTGHGVKRFRCWDSCMYSDFTLMAAGTPRHTQLEKFRQRFMHKLVYYPMNNDGIYGCVGCGRCLRKCPISMNIVKVMKSLSEVVE